RVALGLGQEPFGVVDADGLRRDPDAPCELSDGEHPPILDLAPGTRSHDRRMTDWETLRALADEGNEKAADRLADLADERNDVDTLSELLDEGSQRAGEHLTRRAVAAKDPLQLQRISDAAYGEAGEALDRLLS